MLTKTVTVKNPQGLHARPATAFVQKAGTFSSNINIVKGTKKVNGKSIMGIMTLAAKQGDEITLETDGADEQEAMNELSKILEMAHE